MKRAAKNLLLFPVLALSSCLSGESLYTEPPPLKPMENSRVVQKNRDKVWKHLISMLVQQHYTINTVDRDSGLISISYRGNPESYCDCGKTRITVKDAAGKRSYEFPGARGYSRYEMVVDSRLYQVDRLMDLDLTGNILVQEVTPTSTLVTVSARYYLDGRMSSLSSVLVNDDFVRILGQGASYVETPFTVYFSGTFISGERKQIDGLACQPTGRFENDILSLLNTVP